MRNNTENENGQEPKQAESGKTSGNRKIDEVFNNDESSNRDSSFMNSDRDIMAKLRNNGVAMGAQQQEQGRKHTQPNGEQKL